MFVDSVQYVFRQRSAFVGTEYMYSFFVTTIAKSWISFVCVVYLVYIDEPSSEPSAAPTLEPTGAPTASPTGSIRRL